MTSYQVSGCYDYDIDSVVPCSTTSKPSPLIPSSQLPMPMSTSSPSVIQFSAVSTHHMPNVSSSKVAATPLPLSTPSPDPGRSAGRLALIIGLIIGLVSILLSVFAVVCCIWRRRSRQAYRERYDGKRSTIAADITVSDLYAIGAPVSPRQPMEISHSTATLRPQETHTADGDTSAADELECLSHASQVTRTPPRETRTFIHIEEYSIPDVPPPPYDERNP